MGHHLNGQDAGLLIKAASPVTPILPAPRCWYSQLTWGCSSISSCSRDAGSRYRSYERKMKNLPIYAMSVIPYHCKLNINLLTLRFWSRCVVVALIVSNRSLRELCGKARAFEIEIVQLTISGKVSFKPTIACWKILGTHVIQTRLWVNFQINPSH
jgi:hypothetical protein